MQLLWDLADPKNEEDHEVQITYSGAVGFSALLKLIDDNDVRNVNDLWTAIQSITSDPATLMRYDTVFALHGMAVKGLTMKVGGGVRHRLGRRQSDPGIHLDDPPGIRL